MALAGCRTSTWSSKNITGEEAPLLGGETTNPTASLAANDPTAGTTATGATAPPSETPQQIMAEVRELGAVNPAAQAELMQELEKADPDIWPSVVQNFRSRLAYGERLYQEEMLAAKTAPQQPGQGPQYAAGNPYYANQPIPTANTAAQTASPATTGYGSYQTNPYPTTGQATMPASYPQQTQPSYYSQPQQPYAPQPTDTPTNYSAPMPLPSSPQQSAPIYPQTSQQRTVSKVIQASYEEPIEADSPAESRLSKKLKFTDSDTRWSNASWSDDDADTMDDNNEEGELQEIDSTFASQSDHDRNWQESLAASIETLQKKLASDESNNDSEAAKLNQLRLRFMLLAAGRSTEATEPIPGESEAMTDFWAGQMFGLGTLMDERKASAPTRRNALAKYKLSQALQHLGQASDLVVRNLAFCTDVEGFANIKQFDKYEFQAGEEVILYAELDNLKHEETVDGYRTSLEIGYKIFDSADHLIDEQQSSGSQECSPVLRHDFYVTQRIRLPERLYPGRHILKLVVEDKLGKKYGESTTEFTVK